jgi:tetratricopeptide (TPR) repeat protein
MTKALKPAKSKPKTSTGHNQKAGLRANASEDKFATAMQQNNFSLARHHLEETPPKDKWIFFNRHAILCLAEKDLLGAEIWLRKAATCPDCGWDGFRNLTTVLMELNKFREALPFARKAFELNPDHIQTGVYYSNCLLDQVCGDELMRVCDHFLEKHPDNRQFLLAKASGYRIQGKFNESFLLLDQILQLYPDDIVALRVQADVVAERNSKDGVALYDNAARVYKAQSGKESIPLQWNMSLHLLRIRDFDRGWQYWENGFRSEVGSMGRLIPKPLANAQRADLENSIDPAKWTLVCTEQGIGDQILFLSAMNEAIAEYKKVILACEPRMHDILKRSFPELEITGPGTIEGWVNSHIPKNGFIPLGSVLPRYRRTLQSFEESKKPYIKVDGDLHAFYSQKLRALAKGRPIVGISWKGGFWETQQRNKALEISNWLPIFEQGAMCVNLQYGDTRKEQKYIKDLGFDLVSFEDLDFKKDLDPWLAIAAACDGIISVSTALVHFAGACGQKVGVVMPEPQGPWVWGMDDEWSIAYPEVAIFRRKNQESIRDLVDRVARVIV